MWFHRRICAEGGFSPLLSAVFMFKAPPLQRTSVSGPSPLSAVPNDTHTHARKNWLWQVAIIGPHDARARLARTRKAHREPATQSLRGSNFQGNFRKPKTAGTPKFPKEFLEICVRANSRPSPRGAPDGCCV